MSWIVPHGVIRWSQADTVFQFTHQLLSIADLQEVVVNIADIGQFISGFGSILLVDIDMILRLTVKKLFSLFLVTATNFETCPWCHKTL